jgi:hypothetical protein
VGLLEDVRGRHVDVLAIAALARTLWLEVLGQPEHCGMGVKGERVAP